MTADGVDKIFQAARTRAGLERATCHQLRHTCLTRLQLGTVAFDASFDQVQYRATVWDLGLDVPA
jgi:integrase